LALSGRYAGTVIGAAFTIQDSRQQRMAFRDAAQRAGRNPDEIKYFPGLMTTIAPNKRTALDRRIKLSERTFPQRVAYLQQMLGLKFTSYDLSEVIPQKLLLQERGLFHQDYEGSTLRDHLGAPEQYGIDPRI
jgi:alkanesulfonate monooxygenase SsuD/methylene tetrahydromethanopterin reductase-like flavin-dependent oxidoreductase (luciferase family)